MHIMVLTFQKYYGGDCMCAVEMVFKIQFSLGVTQADRVSLQ